MTTVAEDVLERLRRTEALLEGHFLLTSGLHSGRFVQCAKVLQYPQHAEVLGQHLADAAQNLSIDLVISPALGGVIIGQEVARALGVRGLFGEREAGRMTLRRGFALAPGERALVVEDVTTTGGSVREIIELVKAHQGTVAGVGAILDRSGGAIEFGVPFQVLATLQVQNYDAESCPMCQAGDQAVKPGSRGAS